MPDIITADGVPAWLIKHIQDARSLFGVGGSEWHVYVVMVNEPGGCSELNGFCKVDAVYLNADLEFKSDLSDDDIGRNAAYHEVLHIVHQEVDQVAFMALNRLGKKQRKILKQVYREAVERFIQRMSRSITANVREQ